MTAAADAPVDAIWLADGGGSPLLRPGGPAVKVVALAADFD